MEVIVRAGIIPARASSVINNNGGTQSVKLKGMIMLQSQRRNLSKKKKQKKTPKPHCVRSPVIFTFTNDNIYKFTSEKK